MNTVVYLIVMCLMPTLALASEDEWDQKYEAIASQVCQKVIEQCHVSYGAYETDEQGYPVNNLGRTAIEGKVVIVEKHDPFWGDGQDFRSQVIENPSWLDLALIANRQIVVTGDYHHIYIEGFEVLEVREGVKFVQLHMGS